MTKILILLSTVLSDVVRQPVFWPLVFVIPLFVLVTLLWRGKLPTNGLLHIVGNSWLAAFPLLGTTLAGAYIFNIITYLRSPSYVDHAESTVASISWYAQAGKAVYHPQYSTELYNLPYGPYLYLLNGVALKFFGPSIASSKLVAAFAALAALASMTIVFFKISHNALFALGAIGVYVSLLSYFDYESFWARPDPMILCLVTVGMLATIANSAWSTMVLGAAAGVAVYLKLHAFAYFLPLLFVRRARETNYKRSVSIAIVCGAVVAIAPFLLHNVSLANYLTTLKQVGTQGLAVDDYQQTIAYLFVATIPISVAALLTNLENQELSANYFLDGRWFLGSLLVSSLIIVVAAAKPGNGPHHLIPLIPVLCLLFADMYQRGLVQWPKSLVGAFVLTFAISWAICCYTCGIKMMHELWKTTKKEQSISTDINAIIEKFGKQSVILMGVGGTDQEYQAIYARNLLVFKGFPIGLDPASLMDAKLAGLPEPSLDKVVNDLRGQSNTRQNVIWLIPRNADPFTMDTFYSPRTALFTSDFRRQFHERFTTSEHTHYFDVYTNRIPDSPSPATPERAGHAGKH